MCPASDVSTAQHSTAQHSIQYARPSQARLVGCPGHASVQLSALVLALTPATALALALALALMMRRGAIEANKAGVLCSCRGTWVSLDETILRSAHVYLLRFFSLFLNQKKPPHPVSGPFPISQQAQANLSTSSTHMAIRSCPHAND